MNDGIKNLGDAIEAVVVYNKSNNQYNKSMKDLGLGDYSPSPANKYTSAKTQAEELAEAIVQGDSRDITRKRLAKVLKTGDPINEAKSVMVVLARRELSKLLEIMEALDKIESIVLQRVMDGMYDASPEYELGTLIKVLEGSLSRGLTIIEKVINNPDYEEFLLAYRESDRTGELSTATTIATDRNARQKLRDLMLIVKNELGGTSGNKDNKDNE